MNTSYLYGFCPTCGAGGVTRERRPNGNDNCERGHTYPSKDALNKPIINQVLQVSNLVQGLAADMPDRFFEIFNEMTRLFPGISFETRDKASWEQYNWEQKTGG